MLVKSYPAVPPAQEQQTERSTSKLRRPTGRQHGTVLLLLQLAMQSVHLSVSFDERQWAAAEAEAAAAA